MSSTKSRVAVGFIVVGVLTVVFGTVLTFVGPLIIDDQIVKVRHWAVAFVCVLTVDMVQTAESGLSSGHGHVSERRSDNQQGKKVIKEIIGDNTT